MIRAITEGELEILTRTIERLSAMAEIAYSADDEAEALILKEEELLLHELRALDGVVEPLSDEDTAPAKLEGENDEAHERLDRYLERPPLTSDPRENPSE